MVINDKIKKKTRRQASMVITFSGEISKKDRRRFREAVKDKQCKRIVVYKKEECKGIEIFTTDVINLDNTHQRENIYIGGNI